MLATAVKQPAHFLAARQAVDNAARAPTNAARSLKPLIGTAWRTDQPPGGEMPVRLTKTTSG
jgi:hypothetical protein